MRKRYNKILPFFPTFVEAHSFIILTISDDRLKKYCRTGVYNTNILSLIGRIPDCFKQLRKNLNSRFEKQKHPAAGSVY